MAAGDKPDRALEEAISWLLEVQSAPGDAALRARFDAWLVSDPAHADAWDRARRTWNIVGEATPVHGAARARRQEAGARRAADWPRRKKAALGIAIAACLVMAAAPAVWLRLRADYATGAGQLRSVRLDDGTTIQLGPKSAIATHFEGNAREVTLLAGEAWFDVVHNPARPFVVRAGKVEIRDIGTAFDVRRATSTTIVAVAHGLVDVRPLAAGSRTGTRLAPGDMFAVDPETGRTEQGKVAIGDIGMWRSGRLFANNATVAEVVARLRAYQTGWIVIGDEALARRRVTGTFDLRKPDRALQALVAPSGGQVRRITPLLYFLSAS